MGAQPLEVHQRNAVPAGVGYSRHLDEHDRAPRGAEKRLLEVAPLDQLGETLVTRQNHVPSAVDAQDSRGAREGAEHHDYAPVLADVRDRLGPAADHVKVGQGVAVERTRSVPIGPFGETFTWPPAASGAVATKNSGWA